ncbi:hypothetical protein C4K68_17395 [Pokkaliibacter plantistimulans]|uniref:Molybdate ABC transporter substrate-binding protein n=1 Tax=Proteobacteria bacterium 228 TaxID=2083153 RepID=A0A2S5KMI3_9PROT|nr:hypothetical protein C4K68_17395 [Pokkaliibacter plantistimulans]
MSGEHLPLPPTLAPALSAATMAAPSAVPRPQRRSAHGNRSESGSCIAALFILVMLLIVAKDTQANELHVLTTDDMQKAVAPLTQQFAPDTQRQVSYSTLQAVPIEQQLDSIREADIVLGLTPTQLETLAQSGVIASNSILPLTRGQLAYWQPSSHRPGKRDLYQAASLSIPLPDKDPYGNAAKQALTLFNLWPFPRRVFQSFAADGAFTLVASGSTSSGLVSLTALKTRRTDPRTFWVVPETLYSPIILAGAQTVNTSQPALATAFLSWLNSDSIQHQLKNVGYLPVR